MTAVFAAPINFRGRLTPLQACCLRLSAFTNRVSTSPAPVGGRINDVVATFVLLFMYGTYPPLRRQPSYTGQASFADGWPTNRHPTRPNYLMFLRGW